MTKKKELKRAITIEGLIREGWILSVYDKYGIKVELVGPGNNPERYSAWAESIAGGIVSLEVKINQIKG